VRLPPRLPPALLTRARAPSDFTHARSPDPAVRRALADEIRDASINVGFFYVSHHGIPERAVRGAVAAAQAFFARPEAEKLAVRPLCRRGRERYCWRRRQLDIHKSSSFKGYTALLGENTDPAGRGDLHEGFDIGWEPPADGGATTQGVRARDTATEDGAMSGANVWPPPAHLPDFRRQVLEY
jgi:isopenicillin N synthase-like dioxygenase